MQMTIAFGLIIFSIQPVFSNAELISKIVKTQQFAKTQVFSARVAESGVNTPTPEFGNLVERLMYSLKYDKNVTDKVNQDPALKSLYIQTINHLQHVSFSFDFRDSGYPHDLALKGPYPYKPTLAAIQRAKEFFQIISGQPVRVIDREKDLEKEKQLLEQQKQTVQKIINDSHTTYEEMRQRLVKSGPQAKFFEFRSLVEYLELKIYSDDLVVTHSKTNQTVSNFRVIALEHLRRVKEAGLPYSETLDAVQRAIEFFDIVHRVNDPSRSPKLYHSGRYEYYTHFLEAEAPSHIMMPTLASLGATDILKVRGVPVGFIGVNTDITWVDGYYQTPYEFYVHDINHTRRMWQFFKEYAKANGMTPEQFAKKSDEFVKIRLLPLISINKTDDDKMKNRKRLRKVLLFEILHEDALPAAPDVIEKAVLRPPSLLTPFEEIIGEKRIRYVMEPGATTLAYVYRKLAHDFYDMPAERINNIVSPEFRTRENIIEAAEAVFSALDLPLRRDLFDRFINTDEGFPQDFKNTLEKDIASRPTDTIPLVNVKLVLARSIEKLIKQSTAAMTDLQLGDGKSIKPVIKSFFYNGKGITVNLEILKNGNMIDYQILIPQEQLSIDKTIGTVDQIKGNKRVIQVESGPNLDLKLLGISFLSKLDPSQHWVIVKAGDPQGENILKVAQQYGFETIMLDSASRAAKNVSEVATFYAMAPNDAELSKMWTNLVANDEENKAMHINLDFKKIRNDSLKRIADSVNKSRLATQNSLRSGLQAKNIPIIKQSDLDTSLLKGRTPILFSGASKKSWPIISESNQNEVVRSIQQSLDVLDPNKVVIVTGATDYGVEKIVHEEARSRGFTTLGTVVESAAPGEVGPVTHVTTMGVSWYGKSRPTLQFIKEHNGVIVFMGGGDILNDEIKMASNLGVDFHLMKGPEGASTKAATALPSHAFTGAQGLISALAKNKLTLFKSNSLASPRLTHPYSSSGGGTNKCADFFR